jgi:hypothetical protein
MNDPSQTEAEMEDVKYEEFFSSTESAEMNEETSMSPKDPDTMLSMVVLLITCLALAALAHLFV